MSISFFAECTVLITGASAGIGREFARQLAPAVNTMILVARRNDRLEALELELKIINPKLEVFCRQLDLRDQAALERFCNWLDESALSVDLLVNNAGLGDRGAFIDSEWDRVHAMLQVNIESLTYLTYRILPSMRKSGCGAILNVSKNVAATHGQDGVRCNSLHPGYILSPMNEHQAPEINAALIAGTVLKRPGKVPEAVGHMLADMALEPPTDSVGDVLVQFGDKTINNLYDFTDALRRSKVGDVVEVKVMRDGKPVSAQVKLEQRR